MNCCDYSTIDMGLYGAHELVVRLTSVLTAHDDDNAVEQWAQDAVNLLESINGLEDGAKYVDTSERLYQSIMELDEIWLQATMHPSVEIDGDGQIVTVHEGDCDWAERDYGSLHDEHYGLGGWVPAHYAKWADEGRHGQFSGTWHWACEHPGCKHISLDSPLDDDDGY